MSEPDTVADLASRIAVAIAAGFEDYHARFAAITARARQRFEQRDWVGARQDAVERIALYDLCIAGQMDALRRLAGERSGARAVAAGACAL
jgi:isocitrate dehydrogenase kinase/phosphatase